MRASVRCQRRRTKGSFTLDAVHRILRSGLVRIYAEQIYFSLEKWTSKNVTHSVRCELALSHGLCIQLAQWYNNCFPFRFQIQCNSKMTLNWDFDCSCFPLGQPNIYNELQDPPYPATLFGLFINGHWGQCYWICFVCIRCVSPNKRRSLVILQNQQLRRICYTTLDPDVTQPRWFQIPGIRKLSKFLKWRKIKDPLVDASLVSLSLSFVPLIRMICTCVLATTISL